MKLNTLVNNEGAVKRRKTVGRGRASGLGKTSGRGHTGARSRSGYSLKTGFEGGQMPLFRKLPKRGFSNFQFTKRYDVVNLAQLERLETETVDKDSLVKAGLIRSNSGPIKLLAEGEVTRSFKVTLNKVSESAKIKIEAAGGSVVII